MLAIIIPIASNQSAVKSDAYCIIRSVI